jgi:hypothetical protein
MQHNAFELEIYARTYQEFRREEAARARLLDEAASLQHGREHGRRVGARILAAARSLFTRGQAAVVGTQVTAGTRSAQPMTRGTGSARGVAMARPTRAAEPYAAMVVLARNASAPVTAYSTPGRDGAPSAADCDDAA